MTGKAPSSVRNEAWLAAALAAVAGYVDAFGLVRFATFLSFMSGNTTQTGFRLGQGELAQAAPSVVAIAGFVGGVMLGTFVAHSGWRFHERARFGAVAVLLAADLALSLAESPPAVLGIALASVAMGMMNTTLARVGGQAVNVGFVTGSLHQMAAHLAKGIMHRPLPNAEGAWDTHFRRAALLFGIWAALLAGAAAAGIAAVRFGEVALVAPLLVLLPVAAFHPPDTEPDDA